MSSEDWGSEGLSQRGRDVSSPSSLTGWELLGGLAALGGAWAVGFGRGWVGLGGFGRGRVGLGTAQHGWVGLGGLGAAQQVWAVIFFVCVFFFSCFVSVAHLFRKSSIGVQNRHLSSQPEQRKKQKYQKNQNRHLRAQTCTLQRL